MLMNNNKYKLNNNYKHGNINHTIVKELDDCVIYECEGLGRKNWFELYYPILVPEFKSKGNIIESHYREPKDEDFGICAWTFNDLESALDHTKKDR